MADERARAEREAKERGEAWQRICPPSFQDTDTGLLPNPGLLNRVLQWRAGPIGLLVHGNTGRGKTRCAWVLLAREHFMGRSVAAITAADLAQYPARVVNDSSGAAAWFRRVVRADVLLLDDVFKAKLTEKSEEALFCIVDERTAHGRPILVTTNDTGATLTGRLSPDRGEPMIRRLREFCEDVPA